MDEKNKAAPLTSLGTYVALGFSALAILLVAVLAEVIGVAATERVKGNIGEGLAELAFQTVDKLDRSMFERYREVRLLSRRRELGDPHVPVEQKRAILEDRQSTYTYYAWIGLASPDGKVLAATKGLLEGADVSRRPWFQAARDKSFVGDVHDALLLAKLLPQVDGEPMRFVDVAFPFDGPDGKTAGVLGIHMSWEWASEVEQSIFRSVGGRKRVQILILSEAGTVLLGPHEMRDQKLPLAALTGGGKDAKGSSLVRWPDGHEYLTGFARSAGYGGYPGLGWTILVRQDLEEAYAPVKDIQRLVLWSGIGLALLFSLAGLFMARLITRPIRSLSEAAARIEAGEADGIERGKRAYAEADALEGALHSLVRNLQQKEKALQELNADLERRVEARTAELRDALEGVRASQRRIQSILETAQDAFIGLDLKGNITDWNSAAERLLGWPRDAVLGRQLEGLLIPERFRASYANALSQVQSSGHADFLQRRMERVVKTSEGSEIPVEMTFGLIVENGAPFFGAFLHDITQRREVQRMKDEFVSTVSHELRTPLTSIRGSVDLLLGGAAGTLTPGAKQLLDIASKSCARLVRLIADMLDIEQIESGQMKFKFAEQPLQPLLLQAVEATRAFAAAFEVQFEVDLDEHAPPVNVDADRITQVLVNLLSNAAKFSPACGTVQVSLSSVGKMVRVAVRDHGEGIAPEFHSRIFEKFGIVDASNTRKKGGTGLGLSICKRIIEEHDGEIGFISGRGAGAEFWFLLPAAKATQEVSETGLNVS